MIVTLFDYGAGNLHSLAKAIALGGDEVRVEPDPVRALATDALVLPGVGAFAPAAARLAPGRMAMREAIAAGLPCLGVCLGMQLLFESSAEGPGDGLGLFAGRVTRLAARRAPHIGWNQVSSAGTDPLAVAMPDFAYFAHGFACRPLDVTPVLAWATHESDRFPAAIRRGNLLGVQFHPEKSSRPGLRWLTSWLDDVRAGRGAGAAAEARPPGTRAMSGVAS